MHKSLWCIYIHPLYSGGGEIVGLAAQKDKTLSQNAHFVRKNPLRRVFGICLLLNVALLRVASRGDYQVHCQERSR